MIEILQEIFEVCVIPLLGILTAYVIKWINLKSADLTEKIDNDILDKYIRMLDKTITECVIATNQTYVDTLKKEGSFDKDAQKIAFEKTYNSVILILNEDAKEYLEEAFFDLKKYITEKIEAEVAQNKGNA